MPASAREGRSNVPLHLQSWGTLTSGVPRVCTIMNVSKQERKALELLSLGGKISVEKDDKNRVVDASFITREGWFLDGVGLSEFQSLRTKRFVGSRRGEEYSITREGIKVLQQFRQAQKVAQRNSRLTKKGRV